MGGWTDGWVQGISVLVSDLDIAILRNPFNNLVRDSDIEGASDGWLLEKWAGSSSVSFMESTPLLSGSFSIAQVANYFYYYYYYFKKKSSLPSSLSETRVCQFFLL